MTYRLSIAPRGTRAATAIERGSPQFPPFGDRVVGRGMFHGLGQLPEGAIPIAGRARLGERGFVVLGAPPAGATHFTLTAYDAQGQPVSSSGQAAMRADLVYYDASGNVTGPRETLMHRDAPGDRQPTSIVQKAQEMWGRVTGKGPTTGRVWGQPKPQPTAPGTPLPGTPSPYGPGAPMYVPPTVEPETPPWLVPAAVVATVAALAGVVYLVARPQRRRPRRAVARNGRRRRRRRRARR